MPLLKPLLSACSKVGLILKSAPVSNVIAICALVLTGLQAWTTVYTAKIQTIPDLHFFEAADWDGKPGCGDADRGIEPGTVVLCVENSGVGPARLISMAASFDDRTFEIPSSDWTKISEYLPIEAARSITFFTTVVRTQTVPAGKAIPLLRYKAETIPTPSPMHLLIQSGRFNLSFCYCNFYHDCQSVALSSPNSKLDNMQCKSTSQRWWRAFEPEIRLPSAGGT